MQLPLREIRARYTKSEIFILAWRSMEQYQQTRRQMKKSRLHSGTGVKWNKKEETVGQKYRKDYGDSIPEGLPDKFFDEEGSINLSQVTGAEAVKYLNLIGIKLPVMGGVAKG